jgi:hypothetical protein
MTDPTEPTEGDDRDVERAEEVYRQVATDDTDPVTRREAVEGALEEQGLSEAGGAIGEHDE